jgi:uncharacterized membrane protein
MSGEVLPESPIEEVRDTARAEAFSDGVFAIAITLLALEVRVPSHEATEAAGGLLHALAEQWHSYFAFITSFLTILIMWINHHRMFKMIQRTDYVFLLLNGLLLMGISLAPFISALLADYIGDGENAKVAAAVFAGVYALIAILWNAVWGYAAYKHRLLDPKTPQSLLDSTGRAYRITLLLYLAAVVLALINATLGVLMVFGLAVFYAILPIRSGEVVSR